MAIYIGNGFTQVARMRVCGTAVPAAVSGYVTGVTSHIRGVGEKLALRLGGMQESVVPAGEVFFFSSNQPRPNIPRDALAPKFAEVELHWLHLHQVLASPTEQVRNSCPNDTNFVAFLNSADKDDLIVRVRTNWDNGHFIGQKPTMDGFEWEAGAVFLVFKPDR